MPLRFVTLQFSRRQRNRFVKLFSAASHAHRKPVNMNSHQLGINGDKIHSFSKHLCQWALKVQIQQQEYKVHCECSAMQLGRARGETGMMQLHMASQCFQQQKFMGLKGCKNIGCFLFSGCHPSCETRPRTRYKKQGSCSFICHLNGLYWPT